MPAPRPINAGFRAVLRTPSVLLAELAWRWSFGLTAVVLIAVGLHELQQAVTIAPLDELRLRSLQPVLIGQAWANIFADALPLLLNLAAVLLPALALMWIAAATLGRAVTIRRLLEHFASESRSSITLPKLRWAALVALHFFRAAVMLAVFLGYIAAGLIASRFVQPENSKYPDLNVALAVFVVIFAAVVFVASAINWVLALAPIFIVRDGLGTWDSLAQSVRMFRDRGSQFTAAATMNAFLRFLAAFVATVAGLIPLMMIGEAPGWLIWIMLAAIAGVFSVISDWLLLARLGAYIAVIEHPAPPEQAEEQPVQPLVTT